MTENKCRHNLICVDVGYYCDKCHQGFSDCEVCKYQNTNRQYGICLKCCNNYEDKFEEMSYNDRE